MTHNWDITDPEANNCWILATSIVSPVYEGYEYITKYSNNNIPIDSYNLLHVIRLHDEPQILYYYYTQQYETTVQSLRGRYPADA